MTRGKRNKLQTPLGPALKRVKRGMRVYVPGHGYGTVVEPSRTLGGPYREVWAVIDGTPLGAATGFMYADGIYSAEEGS